MTKDEITQLILAEREYQDQKWGGFDADRKWSIDNWVAFMLPYVGRAVKGDPSVNWQVPPEQIRIALVKVAALCYAALEHLDGGMANRPGA